MVCCCSFFCWVTLFCPLICNAVLDVRERLFFFFFFLLAGNLKKGLSTLSDCCCASYENRGCTECDFLLILYAHPSYPCWYCTGVPGMMDILVCQSDMVFAPFLLPIRPPTFRGFFSWSPTYLLASYRFRLLWERKLISIQIFQ